MNSCQWLLLNSTECCGNRCRGQYCAQHNQQIARGYSGPRPCLVCLIGVRGVTKLCANCGGKRFRELNRYYLKKNNNTAMLSEQDYLLKFSNKLPIKHITQPNK